MKNVDSSGLTITKSAGAHPSSRATPGPWHTEVGGHANRVWTANMEPVVNLCSFGTSPPDIDPTAQANASLIAAAPDLLAIAQRVAEHFRDTDAPLGIVARAAIAKATS
jgi:hypothetical protein